MAKRLSAIRHECIVDAGVGQSKAAALQSFTGDLRARSFDAGTHNGVLWNTTSR
jgi:hypothetical protein